MSVVIVCYHLKMTKRYGMLWTPTKSFQIINLLILK